MHDIVIRTGADFLATFRVVDGDGVAVDLTGATITAAMSQKPGGHIIATFSCAIVSAVDGTFKVQLAKALTTPLIPGPYYWDVLITQGGLTLPWSEDAAVGKVLVKAGVTS